MKRHAILLLLIVLSAAAAVNAQTAETSAEAVIDRAVKYLGGDKYLNVRTQVGRGKFSVIRDGAVISFQSFLDVIVFPDKERTDFRGSGPRSTQVNIGETGWLFDGEANEIREQTPQQIENFKRGINVSLDNLLRRKWRGKAQLTYVGRRQGTLGKRNDIIKLTYDDGTAVEFEFTVDEGTPIRATYTRTNASGDSFKEEDRYAQFLDIGGIRTPFIIDRLTDGQQSSRINYESVEFNKKIPDSIFSRPANVKEMKKDLKL